MSLDLYLLDVPASRSISLRNPLHLLHQPERNRVFRHLCSGRLSTGPLVQDIPQLGKTPRARLRPPTYNDVPAQCLWGKPHAKRRFLRQTVEASAAHLVFLVSTKAGFSSQHDGAGDFSACIWQRGCLDVSGSYPCVRLANTINY